jgi:hypothetical protein
LLALAGTVEDENINEFYETLKEAQKGSCKEKKKGPRSNSRKRTTREELPRFLFSDIQHMELMAS